MNKFMQHLLKKQDIDIVRLIEVLSAATHDDDLEIIRLMAYITGFEKLPTINESHGDYEFVSYNLFENQVRGRKIVENVRYFRNQEEADKAAAKMYDGYWEGDYRQSDNYPIAATLKGYTYDTFKLGNWNK